MYKKLALQPGINRETTRYNSQGGWYECDKVRFRQGLPEKIGGWERVSNKLFLGVCRSLFNWATLSGQNLMGVGTNIQFYLERGGDYYNITPIRRTATLTDPFDTTNGSATVVVTDTAHGALTGDSVYFSGASAVGGLTLDGVYLITFLTADTYSVEASTMASSTANGGGTVTAEYEINTGAEINLPLIGWGAGGYGLGEYGIGVEGVASLRQWSQSNFGEDLVFAYRKGPIFYWDATGGITSRGEYLEDLSGASDVPEICNFVLVSDISRFLFAFGCNELGSSAQDPMLIRWSDQENALEWAPSALNQAGGLRLSKGTEIITATQSRQEVLVWTDSALYGLQYLGAPDVWGAQLLGENTSIIGQYAASSSGGVSYWMGRNKFYMYDGVVKPLPCSLLRYVFNDFNYDQRAQVCSGTNERFNEVWWFYCSADSDQVNRYVVYNHLQGIWYHGNLSRTAWLDTPLRENPVAATYSNNLVYHESGYDDRVSAVPVPINSYIVSSEFDIDDGNTYFLLSEILPDITFDGSTTDAPAVSMELFGLKRPGSGYQSPTSQGGVPSGTVTRTGLLPVEQFTDRIYVRVRARQMAMRIESGALGVSWQLGSPRIDIRPDGRRG